ncbi:hypothetical protein MMC06_000507 [Schaereria dolodes]|nr:hypothetical protein [Schaereria dolodes]
MVVSGNLAFNLTAFVGGLFLLENGADRFIDHTAIIATRLRVSPTLIALLTSGAEWEELAVIVAAISQQRSSLALGNILGSSISNILGAFSLGLIFHPGKVVFDRSSKIYTALLLVLTTIFVLFLAFFQSLGRTAGGTLVVAFVLYVASVAYYIYRGVMTAPEDSDSDSDSESDEDSEDDNESEWSDEEKLITDTRSSSSQEDFIPMKPHAKVAKHKSPPSTKRKRPRSLAYHICQLLLGFFVLSLSGYLLSHSVSVIADAFELSGTLLGMTLLSFATTLPEKFIAVFSGAKGHGDIVVANTAGSNIFLLTLCSGVLYLAGDLASLKDSVTIFELGCIWVSSALLFLVVFLGASRWMGVGLFGLYIAFIVAEFTLDRR